MSFFEHDLQDALNFDITLFIFIYTESTTHKVAVCEHGPEVPIKCPLFYQTLVITTAEYGRTPNVQHSCSPSLTKTCRGDRELSSAKIRELCEGHRECSLDASNGVFGDPCRGIRKYLYVEYLCAGERPGAIFIINTCKALPKILNFLLEIWFSIDFASFCKRN